LDDHANRHEDVLRFIKSPILARWTTSLTPDQNAVAQESKDAVTADYQFLLSRYRQLSIHYQEAISVLVSATSLAESQKQITLATQVTKLTILATIFLPLSYCTSIFGMNFVELDQLSIWIWVVVTFAVGLSTFLVYQWDERQRLGMFWTMVETKIWRMRSRRSTSTTV
jgi:Mg2+ and Co2+ transporter CorA